jgi:hypothetical protein
MEVEMRENFEHRPFGKADSRGHKILRIIGMTFLGVAFAAAFALVFGLLVKVLWNWLMPALFGLNQITYWQAFGIVILAKLLFGAFHPHHGDSSYRFHDRFSDRWKENGKIGNHGDWMMEGWKHYKQYWRERGKADFEDYVRQMKEEKKEPNQG